MGDAGHYDRDAAVAAARARPPCHATFAAIIVAAMVCAESARIARLLTGGDGGGSATPALALPEAARDLEESEQANLHAALERASREPVGRTIVWLDSRTRASGSIRPLRDLAGTAGAACRDYDVIVDFPQRAPSQLAADPPASGGDGIAVTSPRPGFTRQVVARICGPAQGEADHLSAR